MKKFLAAFHATLVAVLISSLAIPPHFASAASLYSTIQFRRGTAAAWTAADNVLAQGEPGYETDTGSWKIGDGLTHWTALKYQPYRLPSIIVGGFTGDNTGNISGFDNLTIKGTATIPTANITILTVPDNTLNGADLLDNTVNGAKTIDNTLPVGKVAATGTPSNATYLRGDGSWGTPSITTSNAILTSYKGLTITTPADNQSVTITADHVVVADNTNAARILSTVSLTIDLDVSGANGLDNGSLTANTGYFFYVIDNGATTAGLASTSATAPILPSGYTYKALVGWATTDNTATPFNVKEFTQVDDTYLWHEKPIVVSAGGSTTTAAVDLSKTNVIVGYDSVPPSVAKSVNLHVLGIGIAQVYVSSRTFDNTIANSNTKTESITFPNYSNNAGDILLIESQKVYWQVSTGTGSVYVNGFTLRR